MNNLEKLLVENPIIAAIRNDDDLECALKSNVKIVFVLYGTLLNISDICGKLKKAGKVVFIHLDLIDGLKEDISGIEFIKKVVNPEGIISTKTSIIRNSRRFDLLVILRIFILDSLALETGIKNIQDTHPDAIEMLPGPACKKIPEVEEKVNVPIISGGIIVEKKDIINSLSQGAVAISTSTRKLWSL